MGLWDRIRETTGGRKDFFLSLDVGTEFVKVLVFRVDKKIEKGVVVGVGQARQRLGNMNYGAISDIGQVILSCERAINQAEKMAGVGRVRRAIMGIAGEFVKGTTTTVHYERARPEVRIDLPELKNIIQKVQWRAFDRIRKQLAWEAGMKEMDVQLINASVVGVKIDGYQVSNPIGFQGREVSVSIFNAYAPMMHLGALQSVAEELDLDLVSIAAEPFAVVQAMGLENNSNFGAIFVDIGGGTTDVALVRNGGLEGTVMFALGGRVFTKRISTELEISFEEAERIKMGYSLGRLSPNMMERVGRALEEDCAVWLSGFEVALESFSEVKTDLLPPRILLCGGGAGLPEIHKSLSRNNWFSNFPFPKKPTISFIQPRDVVNLIDETKLLKNPQNITPMGLASLALDFSSSDEVLSDVLKKTVRLMQN